MVQNTVGRIYLDNNPYETQLQKKWQYLVEPSEKPNDKALLKYNELEDLKVADLACGSGHILNECFDLLYDLYIAEGYGRGEAVENIFNHNLTGIDLDTRAKQLSQFALLLKACQKDAAFADAHCMPNVLTMPVCDSYTVKDILGHFVCAYQLDWANVDRKELEDAFDLMKDADSLGSIMRFEISQDTREHLIEAVNAYDAEPKYTEAFKNLIDGFRLILALTENYHALVMNPPYMGGGNMNSVLSKYVKENYKDGKADLMTVFMLLAKKRTMENGKYGMINLPSWLFLSTFETLRKQIVNDFHIDSLLHMGRGIFGIDWGSTAFVISKTKSNVSGVYFRLHKRNFQHIYYYHIEELFLKALNDHAFKYDFDSYRDEDVVSQEISLNSSENGLQLYYVANQKNFEKIPGCPIGYWVSDEMIRAFENRNIINHFETRCGMATGRNDYYLRIWHEVSLKNIFFNCKSSSESLHSEAKWYPYDKAGEFRKWFGNRDYIVNWYHNGAELTNTMHPDGKRIWAHNFNLDKVFLKHIGWSDIISGTGGLSFRMFEEGFLFDGSANAVYETEGTDTNSWNKLLAYSNSCIPEYIRPLLNPTIHFKPGNFLNLPYKNIEEFKITNLAESNVAISRSDWDAHETSWDFQRNELLSIDTSTYTENIDYKIEKHFEETGEHIALSPAAPKLGSLEWRMEQYKTKWERKFMQLHKNEEELNRQFIDIYGLQDELTPDVPLNEITILQQGEIDVTDNGINWNEDIMTKQLISYAVGCMLGRYRLDKPGLHIAHPNPTDEEIAPYEYKGEQWEIDDDGIMPLMPNDCGFSDNASARFADFIRVALGNEEHVENLNYVEKCLGKPLEQYFVKDFWKDHKKMYQNRPIYWLFSSKKGAFQVIAYMHRMNAYTAERVRSKYLLPYIEHLEAEIDKLDARRAELSTKETKQLQALQKQLDECREYHERLQVVAEQAISFDLDDGVVVNYAKFGDILQKIK